VRPYSLIAERLVSCARQARLGQKHKNSQILEKAVHGDRKWAQVPQVLKAIGRRNWTPDGLKLCHLQVQFFSLQ